MSNADTWVTEHFSIAGSEAEDLRFGFRTSSTLFEGRSDFQDVVVAQGPAYGRMLFLDGCMMTTERDEFVYHEMLAHVPMMAARRNTVVRNVLIIGGGDGGLAREVLRHDTVERVDMVEIDGMVVDVSRKFLPSIGSAFDDPRLNVLTEDGNAFIHRASPSTYDVILIDSADPIGPGIVLFQPPFYKAVLRALRPNGLVAAQGMSPWLQADGQRFMFGNLGRSFPFVSAFVATIPTYPGGQWVFALCAGEEVEPTEADPAAVGQIGTTQYYSAAVHKASFALPPFIANNTVAVARAARDEQ